MLQISPQRSVSRFNGITSTGSRSSTRSYISSRIAVADRLKTTNCTPSSCKIAPYGSGCVNCRAGCMWESSAGRSTLESVWSEDFDERSGESIGMAQTHQTSAAPASWPPRCGRPKIGRLIQCQLSIPLDPSASSRTAEKNAGPRKKFGWLVRFVQHSENNTFPQVEQPAGTFPAQFLSCSV